MMEFSFGRRPGSPASGVKHRRWFTEPRRQTAGLPECPKRYKSNKDHILIGRIGTAYNDAFGITSATNKVDTHAVGFGIDELGNLPDDFLFLAVGDHAFENTEVDACSVLFEQFGNFVAGFVSCDVVSNQMHVFHSRGFTIW